MGAESAKHVSLRALPVAALALRLGGVPYGDSPDFGLDTMLSWSGPADDDSSDFAIDTFSSSPGGPAAPVRHQGQCRRNYARRLTGDRRSRTCIRSSKALY
ncbi:MAG: hypothetical protein HY763_17065 [Planctomycetes bacterium]|nr:hypothetical protein [Planctomycetota bacterium]